MGIVVGGSLTLYALRAPAVASKIQFGYLSREMFLLMNNVILVVATLSILLGTLFPLIMDKESSFFLDDSIFEHNASYYRNSESNHPPHFLLMLKIPF